MPALSAGYLDSGTLATHTLTFDVSIRAQTPSGNFFPDFPNCRDVVAIFTRAVTADHGRSGGPDDIGTGFDTADTIELVLRYGPGPTEVILQTLSGIPATGEPPLFADVTVTRVDANLRLGVTVDGNNRLVYEWFQDSSTLTSITVAATTVEAWPKTEPPVSLGGGGRLMFYDLGVSLPNPTYYIARIKDFTFGGSALPFGPYTFLTGNTNNLVSRYFAAPWAYTVDARVVEPDGTLIAGVNLTHQATARTSGTWTMLEQQDALWGAVPYPPEGIVNFTHAVDTATLADPWLSAQTVRPYDEDLPLRFEGNDPKTEGSATRIDYSAGSLDIDPDLSVLASANAWVIDTGTGTVGGTSTVPIFTISAGPAIVRRPLSGADVTSWHLYALLDLDMTVPAGSDTEVALAATFADSPGDTIEVVYSGSLTFPAGARNTRRVDLQFPVEVNSRPFYGDAAIEVRIIGLLVGVTTVHSLELVAAEQAYVMFSGRHETTRDDTIRYTGCVLALDGSAPSLHWQTDTALDPTGDDDGDNWTDYQGDHQNGTFVLDGVTKAWLGRAPGMTENLLEDTLVELDGIEGLAATYSATALDAALSDSFGNVIGRDIAGNPTPLVRISDWFLPLRPHARITAGTPYDVRAQLIFADILAPAGRTTAQFYAFQRNWLGQVLEGLVTDGNYFREGAAVTVNARGYTGGAPATGDTLLGTGTTDASGFVTIPVRVGTFGATGLDLSAYLTGA